MKEFKYGDKIEIALTEGYFVDGIFIDSDEGYFRCITHKDDMSNFINMHSFKVERFSKCYHTIKHKLPEIEVDTPVIVWNDKDYKCRRYFASWGDNGQMQTFPHGTTSWTVEEALSHWKYYEIVGILKEGDNE